MFASKSIYAEQILAQCEKQRDLLNTRHIMKFVNRMEGYEVDISCDRLPHPYPQEHKYFSLSKS